jgi:hypothetical protein
VRRTYLKLAAAVLASGIAVAACGSVKLGAAAIVGNQRISAAQLNTEIASYNSIYQKYRNQVQLQFPASQTAQQVLGWMVTFQVADRMAQRYGINVTSTDQQEALSSISATIQQESPGATVAEFAAAVGLPADMVSDFGRYVAIQSEVADRLDGGQLPASGSAADTNLQARLATSQCRAAKSLGIQINPQFGQLSYSLGLLSMYSVVPVPSSLSRAQPSAGASPSASEPVLTPPG